MIDADDVRGAALAFPETTESGRGGRPAFQVDGRPFAALGEERETLALYCPRQDAEALVTSAPEKFSLLAEGGGEEWLRLRLDALGDDGNELHSLLYDAWRRVAPHRLSEPTETEDPIV